jgi:NAD(P)-dependent dehydrogenase (short-subunit alcohol dehydrogenase family)
MEQASKIIVITGANRGIGRETAKALARQGVSIVMACRDLNAAMQAREAIRNESRNAQIEALPLDLASLRSIRAFPEAFSEKYPHLDVLINNAGAFSMSRQETEDGFELTMGVNHLGHFLLTHLLLPHLKKAEEARIINVSSDSHHNGRIELDDLHTRKRRYFGFAAYADSKLANIFFTQELADRLVGTSVTANALHPGGVATGMWTAWTRWKWLQRLTERIVRRRMISVEAGAQTSVYLASSDEVRGVTGLYFYRQQPAAVSLKCADRKLQAGLWSLSEELTGIREY